MKARVYAKNKGLLFWNLRRRVHYSTLNGRLHYESSERVYCSTHKRILFYDFSERVYFSMHKGILLYDFSERVYNSSHKGRLFYIFSEGFIILHIRIDYSMISAKEFIPCVPTKTTSSNFSFNFRRTGIYSWIYDTILHS